MDGEHAAARDAFHESREQPRVVVEPMQGGVAEYEIDARGRCGGGPRSKIGRSPFDIRAARARLARLREHVRRIVDAGEMRVRPTFRENPRDVAGAAAEIHDVSRRGKIDARHEIERRTQAFARVLEILAGFPTHFRLLR